jgi:hypothetical protein
MGIEGSQPLRHDFLSGVPSEVGVVAEVEPARLEEMEVEGSCGIAVAEREAPPLALGTGCWLTI